MAVWPARTWTPGELVTASQMNVVRDELNALANMGVGVQTITLTGTQNDLALTSNIGVLRCNNATLLTITGMSAGADGQLLGVNSVGAGQVDLSHQDAGSTVAADRLINFATVGKTSLSAGIGRALYRYDSTTARWRLVAHEQGAYITPAFSAGDYTASSGTWTVDAGDVTTFAYTLKGRQLTVAYQILTTDVSATPGSLQRTIPAGHTSAKATAGAGLVTDAGGTRELGVWAVTAGGSQLLFQLGDGTNFATTAADNTSVFGVANFEVN